MSVSLRASIDTVAIMWLLSTLYLQDKDTS